MITLKTQAELEIMNRCNVVVLSVLSEIRERLEPGAEIAALDAYAEGRVRSEGAVPAFKGYQGFPATLCVSVNEEVVHGIPSRRKVKDGDIVSVDFGVILEGFYGDGAETFAVGAVEPDTRRLLDTTREALRRGIDQMRPGSRVGDVGHAVQTYAESRSCAVVRDYVGHGIGRELHEQPQLPNYGEPGCGARLEAGMVLAIEPMLNLGTAEVVTGSDKWTVRTADGRPSAHFERSVAVTEAGPWVLGTGNGPGELDIELPGVTLEAVNEAKERV